MTRDVRRRLRQVAWAGALLATALASASVAHAQQEVRITGRVVDASEHTPIPAATVAVAGTTIGANTTDSGTFAIRVPSNGHTFAVRRIGYLAQTVTLTPGKTEYTVELQKDVLHLEAQIVTGVATTVSSQNAANAVAAIATQQVNEVPAPTVENAIQGQVPGAIIEQMNGGAPGGGMEMQIRGITSINALAEPLYIVDGVFVNNETINSGQEAVTLASGGNAPDQQDNNPNRIADINPDDIQSIQVLKGASASAIYGSKASSGVVIITTKRGSGGKPQWNFSQKVGQFANANLLNLRSFPTLASAEAWATETGHSVSQASSLYGGPQNFQTQLFGNKQVSYETDLSVGGTQAGTQYFVSALSKYDNGTLINSGYSKQGARANLTQQFNNAFNASINLYYANSNDRRGITGNENNGIGPQDVMGTTPQFVDLDHENPDGTWAFNPYGLANPFADANDIETSEAVQRFIGGGNFDWRPYTTEHQSLDFRFIGGADLTNQHDQFYAPPSLQVMQELSSGLPGVATLQNDVTQYLNYSINAVHHWTPSSNVDATTSIGFIRERRSDNAPDIVEQNLISGLNTPTAGTVTSVFYNRDLTLDQSLYGQEQVLTLNQRLALTAGVTAERSTADGAINKFYAYPHYAASYRIPQFVGFLDELKVRAAYGQSGTLPNYGVKYTQDSIALMGGDEGLYPSSLHGDRSIRPEQEAETELGFDATFLKSRAQFSFTVYQKQISDLLLFAGVTPSEDFNTEWINGGEFTNQGVELQLTATPVQLRNGFTWVTTESFYRNYSYVHSTPVPPFAVGTTFEGIVGSEGYFQPGRSVSELVAPGTVLPNGQPLQVGDFQPSFVVDFSQEFTWKGFRLFGLLDWHRGGTVTDITNWAFDIDGGLLLADTTLSKKRSAAYTAGSVFPYLESATWVKLRELTLSYELPQTWLGWTGRAGLHVSSARLSLTGRNLLMWFPYTGLDPEVSSFGNQQVTTGTDVNEYPPSRSFFLGLDLGL